MTIFKETQATVNYFTLKMPLGFDITIYKNNEGNYYYMSFNSEKFYTLQDAKNYVCDYIKNKIVELDNIIIQIESEVQNEQ